MNGKMTLKSFPAMAIPHYHVQKFDLDTAKTKDDPQEVQIAGSNLTFFTDGNFTGIEFALDSPTNDWIPVNEFGNPYKYPAKFESFYLVWTAQSGKYLRIHVGSEDVEAQITTPNKMQTDFVHGQTTVGTTAVQVSSTSFGLQFGLVVKADDDNSGTVYVGDSDVTTNDGFRLEAGQALTMEVDNVIRVYCIAGAAGQTIHYFGV